MVLIPVEKRQRLVGRHARPALHPGPGRAGDVQTRTARTRSASFDIELVGTVTERIEQLLAQQINPALAAHGGFAALVELIEADPRPRSRAPPPWSPWAAAARVPRSVP